LHRQLHGCRPLQIHQPKSLDLLIESDSFRRSVGPLAVRASLMVHATICAVLDRQVALTRIARCLADSATVRRLLEASAHGGGAGFDRWAEQSRGKCRPSRPSGASGARRRNQVPRVTRSPIRYAILGASLKSKSTTVRKLCEKSASAPSAESGSRCPDLM
jgi:hypothetical protein